MPLRDKVKTIATRDLPRRRHRLRRRASKPASRSCEAAGYGHLPVCMAKTQYSFSTDPNKRGAPTGHIVPIREVRLSAGAEFIVVITRRDHDHARPAEGARRPNIIRLNDKGQIEGLF